MASQSEMSKLFSNGPSYLPVRTTSISHSPRALVRVITTTEVCSA